MSNAFLCIHYFWIYMVTNMNIEYLFIECINTIFQSKNIQYIWYQSILVLRFSPKIKTTLKISPSMTSQDFYVSYSKFWPSAQTWYSVCASLIVLAVLASRVSSGLRTVTYSMSACIGHFLQKPSKISTDEIVHVYTHLHPQRSQKTV